MYSKKVFINDDEYIHIMTNNKARVMLQIGDNTIEDNNYMVFMDRKLAREVAKRYRERKEKGLCISCGKYRAMNGLVRCMICNDKENARQYRKRKEVKNAG